jgi:16S rRNA (cytosine1402-N4)-methyltransferase
MVYHKPVLLKESVDGLNIHPGGVYVDLTFGGGGHSREILSRLGDGRLIAFDQDADAEEVAKTITDKRFMFIRSNFKYFRNFLRHHKIDLVNGIMADLGISSHHIDQPERGFSFKTDGSPDMRMNRESEVTALDIINSYSIGDLRRLLVLYGEVHNAGKVANAIASSREKVPITDTAGLIQAISECIPAKNENKYLARVFQAFRIEVNKELDVLRHMLLQVLLSLRKNGRLVVISYHSLEDRMVKNFMRTGKPEGGLDKDFFGNPLVPFELVTKKVIMAEEDEIRENKRARSARLRIAERK